MNTETNIKCKNCNTWNVNLDYCSNCGQAISAKVLTKIEDKKREEIRKNKPKDKIDIWLDNLKHHRFWIVRLFYYFAYSVAMIFYLIAGFFAFMIATFNG
jgi:ribosomal protein L37E